MNTQTTPAFLSAKNEAEEFVEDSIPYFMDALRNDSIYKIRLERVDRTNGPESSIRLMDSHSTQWRKVATTRQSLDALIAYTRTIKDKVKGDDIDIEYWGKDSQTTDKIVTIDKKTRKPASVLFNQGINPDVYNFVEKAYASGINVLIVGQTGQGKTAFLNTLMDSSKDHTPTVVASYYKEMMFSDAHSEIIEIVGAYNAAAVHALNMNIKRVVIDGMVLDEDMLPFMAKKSNMGTQYIMTGHGLPLPLVERNEAATSPLIEFSDTHPFDLEVDIALVPKKDGKGRNMEIVGVHELIVEDEGYTKLRTLFSGNEFVQDPTRSIRRKMEGKTRSTQGPKYGLERSTMPPLVTSSEEEIEEVLTHSNALGAFIQASNDYEAISHFNELDKFLSKFK